MIVRLIIEAIIYTLLYSLFLVVLFKHQGAKRQLYNYPPAIQKRAIEKGITTQEELDANAKKNKVLGINVMLILCIIMTILINHQYTFFDGFLQSYIFVITFSFFDALVIDTIWFCHSKWWIIPGTEDMVEAYHDYAFHWKWFFISLVSTLPLSVIIGGAVAFAGLFL